MINLVSPGDLIAGYAALVATASLGWPVLTRWSDRQPRLKLDLKPTFIIGHPVVENELPAASVGQVAGLLTSRWFLDIRLTNARGSRFQVIGLDISQAGSEGRVKWDVTHRLLKSGWLARGETCTYRFWDTDLDKASPNRPFQVIATVSSDKRFEITHKLEDGVRVFLHYEWTIQFLKQLGINNLEQGSKVGLSLLGIDNLEQWDRDSLRRLGIHYTGVTIMNATDLYG